MTLPSPDWAQNAGRQEFALMVAGQTLSSVEADKLSRALSEVRVFESTEETHQDIVRFTANGTQAFDVFNALYNALPNHDVWVLPQAERRKALLVCDMDSTIIQTESLDELATYMGIGEHIAAITARAMNGELGFHEALHERVGLLKGLPFERVEQCVQQTQYNNGAKELMQAARAANMRTVLVSGGFSPFVRYVADDLGFDHWVANELEIEHGKLTGRVSGPVVDKDTKLDVLKSECAALSIDTHQACSIGDGANDIEMLVAAGLGVAYRAKPVVLQTTPYHLKFASLQSLVPLMDLPANVN